MDGTVLRRLAVLGSSRRSRRRDDAAPRLERSAEHGVSATPSADMGLADTESLRSPRHPAMTHHGTKKVDMSWVHHASTAWK
jgi:hypothetical protein